MEDAWLRLDILSMGSGTPPKSAPKMRRQHSVTAVNGQAGVVSYFLLQAMVKESQAGA